MQTLTTTNKGSISALVRQLSVPAKNSHKGQNGKLLVIGGSELFHAPLIWAAEVASHLVDMVHVTSPYMLNNKLMEERLKQRFFNGIVVPWEQVEAYIQEDDAVLIGPGMTRSPETKTVVDRLLTAFATKKWIVDGGALQEVEPTLLYKPMIVTPHHKEWERIEGKLDSGVTVLLKGLVDKVQCEEKKLVVEGGNEGMTKGGTGDVLAGLTAALATTNDGFLSAAVASWVNKRAGDLLYQKVGRFFTATDLVRIIPQVLHELVG